MGKQCEVCEGAESKYKCPHCFTPYCSIACYHKHKEVPCLKPEPRSEPVPEDDTGAELKQPPRSFEADEDDLGFRLRKSQLEAVAASDDIRQMLSNQILQQLIQQIDSSKHPEEDLDKALEGPAFREFCNKVLNVLGPEEHSHVTQS